MFLSAEAKPGWIELLSAPALTIGHSPAYTFPLSFEYVRMWGRSSDVCTGKAQPGMQFSAPDGLGTPQANVNRKPRSQAEWLENHKLHPGPSCSSTCRLRGGQHLGLAVVKVKARKGRCLGSQKLSTAQVPLMTCLLCTPINGLTPAFTFPLPSHPQSPASVAPQPALAVFPHLQAEPAHAPWLTAALSAFCPASA